LRGGRVTPASNSQNTLHPVGGVLEKPRKKMPQKTRGGVQKNKGYSQNKVWATGNQADDPRVAEDEKKKERINKKKKWEDGVREGSSKTLERALKQVV